MHVVLQRTGVYRSNDGGRSFSRLTSNLRLPGTGDDTIGFGSNITDFRQLAIDPFNSSSLLVTTNRGLFRSSDGGNTWNYATMPFRQQDAAPFAVTFAPSTSNVIYVSSGAVILKSTDGGTSWTSSDTGTNGLVTTILVSPDLPQLAFAGVSE